MDHDQPFHFASFHVDVQDQSVWRAGHRLSLTPKPFAVLCYFVTHPRRLVTLTDLKHAVWGTTHVEDTTVVSVIKTVRQVLGDTATAPQFLATVRGRGYRFLGEQPPSVPLGRPAFSPLVGREAECTALTRCLTAVEQARRHLVFITGELGMGKTALLEAFAQQLVPAARYWIARGEGVEAYGAGEPYMPFLTALGHLAQGPDAPALTAVLRQTAPTWLAQLPWLIPPTERALLAQELQGATTSHMLRELAAALETLAHQRPVILLLDDMHWSDQASMTALAYLARRSTPARLLVLVTYRPEEAALQQHAVHALRLALCTQCVADTLALAPVTATAVRTYLTQRVPACALPDAVPQALYQRTDGHLLFLVTLVEDLLTRGVLAQEGHAWQGQATVLEALQTIPATLEALVLHQLGRLSVAEQDILRAGSVAGLEFSAALAAPRAGATLAAEAVCAGLAQRGLFLESRGLSKWPDGTLAQRFRFRHALYHHVLYATIPAGERSRLHRTIGARLALGFGGEPDTVAAELAMHFDRGEDQTRACQYRLHAAEHALRRSAHAEVITHCTHGLTLLTHVKAPHVRARRAVALYTLLGHALTATRGFAAPEVEQAYTHARTLCRQTGETRQLLPVLRGLWSWSLVRAAYPQAQALSAEILQVATRLHDLGGLLEGHRTLGATLFFLGDLTLAQTHLTWVVAQYAPAQQQAHTLQYGYDPKVVALCYLAYVLWCAGAPDQALQHVQEASALAEALAQPFNQVFAWAAAAMVHQFRGDVAACRAYAEQTIALAQEQGFTFWAAQELMHRGWAMAMQGDADHGVATIQAGLEAYQATGAAHWWSHWQALLAEAAGYAHQDEAALAALEQALVAVRERQERFYAAEVYRLKGEVLIRDTVAGEGAGEACFHEALAAARRDGARSLELRAALSLSRLWQRQGKRAEAYDLLRAVYSQCTEGWETADLQEAQQCLADLECERLSPIRSTVLMGRSGQQQPRRRRTG